MRCSSRRRHCHSTLSRDVQDRSRYRQRSHSTRGSRGRRTKGLILLIQRVRRYLQRGSKRCVEITGSSRNGASVGRHLILRGRRPRRNNRRARRASDRRDFDHRLLRGRDSRGAAYHARGRMGANHGPNVHRDRTRAFRRGLQYYDVNARVSPRVARGTRGQRRSRKFARRDRALARDKEFTLFQFFNSLHNIRRRGDSCDCRRVSKRRRSPTWIRNESNLSHSPRDSVEN